MNTLLNFYSIAILTLPMAHPFKAADLTINIFGVKSAEGLVSCTLYSNADGFPFDGSKGIQQRLSAKPDGVTCHYINLEKGSYAIAASHDPNHNRINNTNIVGSSTEDWGRVE